MRDDELGIAYFKGHGTQNDFVLLPDLKDVLELTTNRVRALTDRRRGLGADGVLRAAPTASSPEVLDQADHARWFMDYRNADGSAAQMCGNGARLFARYLVDEGLETSTDFAIATRGGVRQVKSEGDRIWVEMGPAVAAPLTPAIEVTHNGRVWPAVGVHLPNPHAVVFVDDLSEVGSLVDSPSVQPTSAFPQGVNVEFVATQASGGLRFRVHERGVGETRSCGTGACAVAWAYWSRGGAGHSGGRLDVDVPGGRLQVERRPDGHYLLSGPTEFVARGHLDAHWWKDNE